MYAQALALDYMKERNLQAFTDLINTQEVSMEFSKAGNPNPTSGFGGGGLMIEIYNIYPCNEADNKYSITI